MSMFIILPKDVGGLPTVEQLLTGSFLDQIDGKLFSTKLSPLTLPRFETASEIRMMKDALISLGLTDLFSPDKCDLTGMSDSATGVYVSEVIHKAIIKVNEQGTQAAAATGSFSFSSINTQ